MSIQVTWYGHNCWLVDTGSHKILIDPFLEESPTAPIKAADVEADFVVVSHGHQDHIADAAPIAKRTGATVMANFEVGEWLKGQGVEAEKVIGMNPGGGCGAPFGRLSMTIAHHSSSFPDGSYAGVACGVLIESQGKRLYFACDTSLFLDMKLIGAGGLDLAVLPIGDLFTMGPTDSLEAIKLLSPDRVAPCHYNTWPPIAQNTELWSEQVRSHTAAEPVVLEPGGVLALEPHTT